MSEIQLDKHGNWTLETRPDFDGELALDYTGDRGDVALFLDTSKMMTLWSLFDSITSRCLCSYIVERSIADEYDKYTLNETDPECPFHGEKG